MRRGFVSLCMGAGLLASSAPARRQATDSLTIDLRDDRRSVSQAIDSALVLRVQNASTKGQHQGWEVEVLRRPVTLDSRNLILNAPHGPDPSDVEAWHVAEKYYPNERQIDVRGYPITVTIRLIDPTISGTGADAQFTSGSLRVSWKRRQ
jgi:hypothetical protein